MCLVWPANLVTCVLFNTLHSKTYAGMGNRGGISRERFFMYVFIGGSCWYILPGYLFEALSTFSWVCWIAPNNIKLNHIFGYESGLVSAMRSEDRHLLTSLHRACLLSPLIGPRHASKIISVGHGLADVWR